MRKQTGIRAAAARPLVRVAGVATITLLLGASVASGSLASARSHHHRLVARHGQVLSDPTASARGHVIQPFSLNTNKSTNWSGYNQGSLEQGGQLFHSITGTWTVPTASQHTKGQAEYSADWVGIGGGCVDSSCAITDATLIQTGTEQDVSSSGASSYSAWYELVPAPSLTIAKLKVHAGDHMFASISELVPMSNVWRIEIKDLTDRQSFVTTVPYASTHDTAEWIEETPLIIGTGGGFAALPSLTSPVFDHATVNGATANLKSSEAIQLVNSSGGVIADPSAPDPDKDGFNVCAWAGSCAQPGSS
jgi:Peptidase A4 family